MNKFSYVKLRVSPKSKMSIIKLKLDLPLTNLKCVGNFKLANDEHI